MIAHGGSLLWLLIALPAIGAIACRFLPTARAVLAAVVALSATGSVLAVAAAIPVFGGHSVFAAREWLFLDALSALHLLALYAVVLLSSAFAWEYFDHEIRDTRFGLPRARIFGSLWLAALASTTLALVSNNLGLMWVGIEATTLVTALLIALHRTRASLEAMWKYLLLCSVGMAFAFMGTLLVAAAAAPLRLDGADAMLWTRLRASASHLDMGYLRIGFLFVLVGFGTKAGLAPMHTWLPDAHSQAPSPVSALFSGFLLSSAVYAILRYLPIVEAGGERAGWAFEVMRTVGAASLLVAAAFLVFQRDVKRLLAYSSVEHMGVVAIGVGLGTAGAAGALLHMLGHACAKVLAFSAAGRLGQAARTHDLPGIADAARMSPWWRAALVASLLSLMGVFPSVLFFTELQIAAAAAANGAWVSFGVLLGALVVSFVALARPLVAIGWAGVGGGARATVSTAGRFLVAIPLAAIIGLGLWLPEPVRRAIDEAARTVSAAAR